MIQFEFTLTEMKNKEHIEILHTWDYKTYYEENKEKIKEYNKEWRKNHPDYAIDWKIRNIDKVRNYAKIRLQKLRLVYIEILGGKCVMCGIDDERVLDFHHKDPTKKETTKGSY